MSFKNKSVVAEVEGLKNREREDWASRSLWPQRTLICWSLQEWNHLKLPVCLANVVQAVHCYLVMDKDQIISVLSIRSFDEPFDLLCCSKGLIKRTRLELYVREAF